jgi:hypothetical protein
MARTGPGSNAQLIKEQRILKEQIEALKRELRTRPARQRPNKRVYADRPFNEFSDSTKQSFIESCKNELKTLLTYASPIKRRQNRTLWESINSRATHAFEEWSIENTGNRWLVHSKCVKEAKIDQGRLLGAKNQPSEDYVDVTLTHKGYLRYMLNAQGQNIIDEGAPPTADIFMHVRVHRFELE